MAVASLALMVPATPAPADPPPDIAVRVDPPAVDDARATISGSAQMAGALDWITGVSITVTSRQHPRTTVTCDTCATIDQSPFTAFSFATPDLDYNGPYDVSVVVSGQRILAAVTNGAPVSNRTDTTFRLAAPPAPPANVTAVVNADGSVTVSWSRNAEPDLVGYQVLRQAGKSAFQAAGPAVTQPPDGSTVQWTDATTAPTGGQFGYVVVAARLDGDGAVSDRATSASTGVSVSVPAPAGPNGGPAPGSAGIATPGHGGVPTGSPGRLNGSSSLTAAGAPPEISPAPLAIPDGEFSPNLPYGARNDSNDPEAGSVEILGHPTNRRTLLVPIAAGLLLCMIAFHLRRLNRGVSAPPVRP